MEEDNKEDAKSNALGGAEPNGDASSGTKVPKIDASMNNSQETNHNARKSRRTSKPHSDNQVNTQSISLRKSTLHSQRSGKKKRDKPVLTLLDLTNKSLQAVYNEDKQQAIFELTNSKARDQKTLKYDLIMCFLLAVHIEKKEM
jgi:hypothetical protein